MTSDRTLVEKSSPYQKILLVEEGPYLALYLDGYYQFRSDTERTYHEFLVGLPLSSAERVRTVLIMGGGDGLALREALRQPDVELAYLVELDPDMVELAQRGALASLNEMSLRNPRTRVIVGDASEMIDVFPDGALDVVVADFPAATSDALRKLYSDTFYDRVFRKLSRGGVFVTQVSEPADVMADIRQRLGQALGHAFTLIGLPKRTEVEAFVYGSRVPFAVRRPPLGTVLPEVAREILESAGKGCKVVTYRKRRERRPKV